MTVNIYDCTPTVIDEYTATGNADNGYVSTTTIIRKSDRMIIILDIENQVGGSGGAFACNLPIDTQVGDIIEMYSNNGGSFFVNAPSDETFLSSGFSPSIEGSGSSGSLILRKVASALWGVLK